MSLLHSELGRLWPRLRFGTLGDFSTMKIGRRIVTGGVVVVALLGALILFAHYQASLDSRILTRAVTGQLDGHSSRIATMLTTMSNTDTILIEDAAYRELQTVPSTSLILRSDIKVTAAPNGLLQCVIDTSRFGIAPLIIRQSTSSNSTP